MTILKKILLLRSTPWLILLILFPAFSLSAQTAEELDTLLETQELSAAGAARFVLGAADLLPPELSGADAQTAAYEMAKAQGWITLPAGDGLTLKDAAWLVMNAFNIEGGMMYSLFPGPRYAYREMIYRKLIQGRADPDMCVSGQRLLQIIDRTQNYTGDSDGSQGGAT